MKNIVDNPMVKFTAGVVLIFLALTMFVEVPTLKLWLDAARIAIFAVLWVVLVRTAWAVYWSGAKTGSERLAVALSVLPARCSCTRCGRQSRGTSAATSPTG